MEVAWSIFWFGIMRGIFCVCVCVCFLRNAFPLPRLSHLIRKSVALPLYQRPVLPLFAS